MPLSEVFPALNLDEKGIERRLQIAPHSSSFKLWLSRSWSSLSKLAWVAVLRPNERQQVLNAPRSGPAGSINKIHFLLSLPAGWHPMSNQQVATVAAFLKSRRQGATVRGAVSAPFYSIQKFPPAKPAETTPFRVPNFHPITT
jgi:hypothetical protein